MEFLNWWLESHWILSTIFTPSLTVLWCIFKNEAGRAVLAFGLIGLYAVIKYFISKK